MTHNLVPFPFGPLKGARLKSKDGRGPRPGVNAGYEKVRASLSPWK